MGDNYIKIPFIEFEIIMAYYKAHVKTQEILNTALHEEIPKPKPPKLDFSGLTVEDRMWRTVDGIIVSVVKFDYIKRVWLAERLQENGSFLSGWHEFTEDGDNQELGYLKDRRRGSEKGWPSVVVGEVEGK